MSQSEFKVSSPEVGTKIEVPEEYEEEIVKTARSWNYPGDADGRDIYVNSDYGRIKVVECDDSVEVYDQGAAIEGFREAFSEVFQREFGYQRVFDRGYDVAAEEAEEVEVFEFDDESVVVAGERSEVRRLVQDVRPELGKEYDGKSLRNFSCDNTDDKSKSVMTDGGFPVYDGTRHVEPEKEGKEEEDETVLTF